ncbi:hypothetical protein C0J08_06850 [Marinomonas sp. CT5]|uniref:type II secretion system protein n=1 Tax=Marinomonas sp. CT5 TaxID=2066133 RepID=UPI0017B5ADB0|nr:hypothetical protein [Marinomonas sp. CT5]NVK72065.1 hypothetical protein [Oceanospirillaceae bacterium]QUX95153.1 hypothetical protein C0J08_06850 [Marinomonas sp. CT5]
MNCRRYLKGSLLVELMVICALIALFLPLLVTAIARMQDRQQLVETYQDQHSIKAAIEAHVQAQWSRLLPASCYVDESLFLTIGSGMSPPIRLATRVVDKDSDWLMGVDYGLCRGSVNVQSNPVATTMSCHWKAGDNVTFSTCQSRHNAQVTSVTSKRSLIKIENQADQEGSINALGQSGIIESQDGFYWYISKGKDGWNALWRTPEESGNSLELWNGIERFTVFPLLDDNQNGMVDTLETRYGKFPLKDLRALWVEYQYRLNDCKLDRDTTISQYQTMRGETWHYFSPCQGVGNQIIVL